MEIINVFFFKYSKRIEMYAQPLAKMVESRVSEDVHSVVWFCGKEADHGRDTKLESFQMATFWLLIIFSLCLVYKSNCYWLPQCFFLISFSVSGFSQGVAIWNGFGFVPCLWSAFFLQDWTAEWTSSGTGGSIIFARGCRIYLVKAYILLSENMQHTECL